MKKTVLFINGHLDTGGCERSLVDVLKNMDYEKYEVDLLLLEHTGDYFEEIPKKVNVNLYSLDNAFGSFVPCLIRAMRQRDWFSFFFRIRYILWKRVNHSFGGGLRKLFTGLKDSYDIIIAYRPGICTELAAFTFKGRKKISWWHHGIMNISGGAAEELHEAYKKMDSVVAVSLSSLLMIADSFPDIKGKLTIVPNMINPCELLEKAKKYSADGFRNACLKIVSVGRMSPEKNMDLCPQVAVYLKKMGLDFKWLLIGDGENKVHVSSMISKYGLQEDMIMLGRKSNPYPYISDADIMIHPSLVESQGITILESMALSTPVIAVASAGPREFIKSGENGYLVNPDANEIARLIELIYIRPEIREKVVENAMATVRQFEPERIIKCIEKIMEA